ncbi:MAG TPA: Holliday junction branch migration protein RuvA [bacterium]
MIAYLEGTVHARLPDGVVLLTSGGVGYQLRLTTPLLADLPETGHKAAYYVSTVVRADEITLYGFGRPDGKALFELLITVSGIGPKLALALLSAFSPAEAVSAIVAQDIARLSSIPGIGKKTATRLCLELTEKLAKGWVGTATPAGAPTGGQSELISALTNLGFPEKDVLTVVRQLPAGAPFPEQLRKALGMLGRT